MKEVIGGTQNVDGATRKPYTHPRVKLHNFGPADIILTSGCSPDCGSHQGPCGGTDLPVNMDSPSCDVY